MENRLSRDPPPEDYFVAGAPLGPERRGYVVRPADRHLIQALREGRSCHLFAPRLMGKTSLMLRALPQLRESGRAAIVVELAQLGGREGGGDAGRWFYTFAHRMLRELRLKLPLQRWWQERVGLTATQRLVEFFRELVLAEVAGQLVIFIDDLEVLEGLGFAGDFLQGLRSCLAAAGTDAEFRRLGFVLLGVTTPSRLAPDPGLGPFELSEPIPLEDFTLAETLALAPGLPVGEAQAKTLLERVHYWTGGQPYLTQKLCRALARSDLLGSGAEEVDRLVEGRLLGPAVLRSEPLLGHVAARLQDRGRRRAQLLSLYGRIRKGLRVPVDPASPLQDRLWLLGLVVDDGRGRLRLRNRVFAAAFTTRWVNQQLPLEFRGISAAAAVLALLVGGPLWYTQVLPRPHVTALSEVDADKPTLLHHHRRLRAWPGYTATADRLLAAGLERVAEASDDLPVVLAARDTLLGLPGYTALADALPVRHWQRRLARHLVSEDRDRALMTALQAMLWGDVEATATAARLLGEDYPLLQATLRPTGGVTQVAFGGDRTLVVTGRDGREVEVFHLESGNPVSVATLRPTGLLHEWLEERVRIDRQAPAGEIRVTLEGVRGDAGRWQGWLVTPTGEALPLSFVPESAGTRWEARADAGELDRRGEWRLRLAAATPGEEAVFTGWRLAFGDGRAVTRGIPVPGNADQAVPSPGFALPGVRATAEVTLLVAPGQVIAVPDGPGARGSVLVWSLATGEVVHRFELPAEVLQSGLGAEGRRLLLRTSTELLVFDLERGLRLARLPMAADRLLAEPVLGPTHRHLAWLSLDEERMVLSLLSLEDGEPSIEALPLGRRGSGALQLALGPGGGSVALAEGRGLRVWQLPDGALRGELELPRAPSTLSIDPRGDWLAMAAADGSAAWYRLPELGAARQQVRIAPVSQWRTAPLLPDAAGRVALLTGSGSARLLRLADGAALTPPLYHGGHALGLTLSPDGRLLVTHDGERVRLWQTETVAPAVRDTRWAVADLDREGRDALLGDWTGGLRILPAAELRDAAPATTGGVDYLGHTAPVSAVVMSPDRTRVASGGADGVIRLWDTLTGAPLPGFLRHGDGAVSGLYFSPDGGTLLSLGQGGVERWRVADGQRLGGWPSAGRPTAALFLPTPEPRVLIGDAGGNLALWPLEGDSPLALWRADGAVTALAWLPGTGWVVSGDLGGRVQLWAPDTGERIGGPLQLASAIGGFAVGAGEEPLLVATARWVHRFSIGPDGLEAQGGVFPARPVDPGTVRSHGPGGEPVGLGGPLDVELRPVAAPGVRPPVLAEPWATRLGLTLQPDGAFGIWLPQARPGGGLTQPE